MRKTRDLIELVNSVSTDLPDEKRHEEICNLILKEFQTLEGKDLAPYLSELVFDMIEPGTRIVLKFPVGAHVFDS